MHRWPEVIFVIRAEPITVKAYDIHPIHTLLDNIALALVLIPIIHFCKCAVVTWSYRIGILAVDPAVKFRYAESTSSYHP